MAIRGPIERYDSIGHRELHYAIEAIQAGPLSGFIGGNLRGGQYVQRLEELWANKFKVRHAIACNSATSGLLAACVAAGVGPGDEVVTTPFTMSATAAAPALLGANIHFSDINPDDFTMNDIAVACKANIVTSLFGHPGNLAAMRSACDSYKGERPSAILIEDNSQSPLAMEHGRYAGTIGHIGVFSLNVHKHISCGEGGVVVTNDDRLAESLRLFINHGEMASSPHVGLNLRMTEITAAIAISQLNRIEELVQGRVIQAEKIIKALAQFKWLRPPSVRDGCTHVYYVVPFVLPADFPVSRQQLLTALAAEGVPLVGGYVDPLYRLPAFSKFERPCPVAEEMHDKRLLYFSNCEWTLTDEQIEQMGEAFSKVSRELSLALNN